MYEETISIVDKMYITEINKVIEGDTYFPELNESDFSKEIGEKYMANIQYTYVTYTRIK